MRNIVRRTKKRRDVLTLKSKEAKKIISEDDIRHRAYEIYLQRIDSGQYGTALDDWHKAKESLRSS